MTMVHYRTSRLLVWTSGYSFILYMLFLDSYYNFRENNVKDTEKDSVKETKEQERKKAYLAKEEELESAWNIKKAKRAEERAARENEQTIRDQARRKA